MVQVLYPQSRPRIGLALGSGVARGWAHLGAIRALARHGIEPDVIAGTSIGAVVGGVHLAGKAEALETWARSLTKVRMISYTPRCAQPRATPLPRARPMRGRDCGCRTWTMVNDTVCQFNES